MVSPPFNRLLSNFRLEVLLRLIFLAFLIIGLRLAYLQLAKGQNYRNRVSGQSTRHVWLPAMRGLVYDRNGVLLAYNQPERNLVYEASRYSKRAQTNAVKRLSSLLRCLPGELKERLRPNHRLPDGSAVLARNLDERLFTRVAERQDEIPGLKLDYTSARNYPKGVLTGHLTGYTGLIRSDDKRLKEPNALFHINDIVGRSGLESACDQELHGRNGRRMVEVDRVGRYSGVLLEDTPLAGEDIVTTLDVRLQEAAAKALEGKVGSAVAVDVRNGEVLALVSMPSYDPNLFIGGITPTNYALLRDNPDHPLLNRAIQGLYPLGSVFKLITSMACLEKGVFTENTLYPDNGSFKIGNHTIHNYHKAVYGSINVVKALEVSCNTFFCNYANQAGADNLAFYARAMGLGDRTGLELGNEAYGQVPTPTWKKNILKESWHPGDTVNLSIGHGYILVTPVQIARMGAVLATGGDILPLTLVKSYVRDGVTRTPQRGAVKRSEFSKSALATVRKGMYQVVNAPHGSGRKVRNYVKNMTVVGKTGSAMLGKHTYAWFCSYAPFENPEIAVAVLIENATSGGTDAAPAAGMIYGAYEKIKKEDAKKQAQEKEQQEQK